MPDRLLTWLSQWTAAALDRLLTWVSDSTAAALTWFDDLPFWLRALALILIAVACFAGMHFDELKRERDWCEFRRWQRWRRRIAQLVLPRELR
jgi:hypothetical protein